MNNKFSSFSIAIIFLCLTILGFFFIPKLSIKLNPSRKQPVINVSFTMWGQSSRIVEAEVTSKLEAMLNRMKGIESLHSHSKNNGGDITIHLSEHIDPDIARFEVSTIIRQVWPLLPDGVSYPSIEMLGTSDEANYPFLRYTINAPYSPIEIQEFVDNNIRPKLAEIKGINKVDVQGASRFVYKLEYDYPKIQNHNVSVDNISSAINSYLTREFMGMADYKNEDGSETYIRIKLCAQEIGKEFDPSKIQVTNKEGTILFLDQLVTTTYEEEEFSSFFRINGLNSIYISIYADEQSNRLKLSKVTQERLNEEVKNFPPGYESHLTYNEGKYLKKELSKIYYRSGLTVILLLLFVFIVYRNTRYSLIIVLSLIANISIASIFYVLLDIEMHLFSLAGLTISITLIIDNFIIMSDQIVQRGNKKAFMAILTATLTTIGALGIVFFLDKKTQLNLLDFVQVVIINLTLSLAITFLLIPALVEKLKLTRYKKRHIIKLKLFSRVKKKRTLVTFNHIYENIILFCSKKKVKKVLVALLILAFGIPVFLLPDKIENDHFYRNKEIEKENKWISFYNNTIGSAIYKEHVKDITDKALGGTMRLFARKVKNGSYSSGEKQETILNIMASLPNGSTKQQMDVLIREMEQFLSQYEEIRQYESSVQNGQRASIRIMFKEEFQKGSFPHILYSKAIEKANDLGGGSWSVYGVGDAFNNEIKDQAGSSKIKLLGYNYDVLNTLANQMRDSLLQHRRIKEVTIDSEFSWYKSDYSEFVFNFRKDRLAEVDLLPVNLYNSLIPLFQRNMQIATWITKNKNIPIKLYSKQSNQLDIWHLEHYPGKTRESGFHLSELANIENAQMPQNIAKENQQYRLCLQYEYIGSHTQAYNVMNRYIDSFNTKAPLGYRAETESYRH